MIHVTIYIYKTISLHSGPITLLLGPTASGHGQAWYAGSTFFWQVASQHPHVNLDPMTIYQHHSECVGLLNNDVLRNALTLRARPSSAQTHGSHN